MAIKAKGNEYKRKIQQNIDLCHIEEMSERPHLILLSIFDDICLIISDLGRFGPPY